MGGGRPEIGPFLKGKAGAWGGRAQKPTCRLPGFLGPNEMLHFGHLLVVFDGFHRVSNAETLIYGVFVRLAWQKYVLQHAENCVNTTVFARFWP